MTETQKKNEGFKNQRQFPLQFEDTAEDDILDLEKENTDDNLQFNRQNGKLLL